MTTVFAISEKAGILPKLTPAMPTAVVKLVKKTGVKFIFKLSIIACSLSMPSPILVRAIDKIWMQWAKAIVRMIIGAIIKGG